MLEGSPRTASKVTIPKDIAAVNAGWLTDALSTAEPGLLVYSAEVLESLGGACTKLRVRLETNRPDFPATVIVKGCLEPHCEYMKEPLLREVRNYRVVPSLGVESVKLLFSQGDEDDGAIMVMEDLTLRGAKCLRTVEPITDFSLMAKFLQTIARIHATWWNSPDLSDGGSLSWIQGLVVPRYASVLQDPEQFAATMALPRATATPRVLKDPTRLLAAINQVTANRFGFPLTITHGDLNLSNIYTTRDNEPGFLDWTMRRMPGAMDVTYFIVGSLDVTDRRRWEAALLQHYLGALDAYGLDAPHFDLAWHAYRAWPIWGEIVWLLNRTAFHNEAACTAVASRFGNAMVDLDTFGALAI